MKQRTLALATGLLAGMAMVPAAWADKDRAIPAEQLIAAVQAAVAAHPGMVESVEVKEDKQRVIVEVEVVPQAQGQRKREIKVDANTREVIQK